jgi:hypothetical protein
MKKTIFLIGTIVIGAMVFSSCQKSDDTLTQTQVPSSDNTIISDGNRYGPGVMQLVAQTRQATDKYHDPAVAIADGYTDTGDCVSIPGVGGMGVHFVHFGLVDGTFDPLQPEALMYEIKNDGSYKLVGFEYLYNGTSAPSFAGQIDFHLLPLPVADYALHVWAWKANPTGLFEDWNPNVTCP